MSKSISSGAVENRAYIAQVGSLLLHTQASCMLTELSLHVAYNPPGATVEWLEDADSRSVILYSIDMWHDLMWKVSIYVMVAVCSTRS